MKYVVCYSGGESSALCAVHCVRKFGKKNVILLNHNISSRVEHKDIKRFKQEVAEYLGLPITYANIDDYENKTPCGVCIERNAIHNPENHQALCTYYLKTLPFYDWLGANFPRLHYTIHPDVRIVYGFDKNETERITRRVGVMALQGYQCYFPLFEDKPKITDIEQLGIAKPITYRILKHANCIGCLKAGKQHWYTVYCLRKDVFQEAIALEEHVGYSIIKGAYLKELVPLFEEIKRKGICPSDKGNSKSFWKRVNDVLPDQDTFLPCDCAVL